jgi:hypothetical protein
MTESNALATSLDRERDEPCINAARSSGVAGRAVVAEPARSVPISRGYHEHPVTRRERKTIVLDSLGAADRGARTADHLSVRRPRRGARLGSRSSGLWGLRQQD